MARPHTRRLGWLLCTAGFLLWQLPWPAAAAVRQAASAHAQCACRGSSACCCLQRQASGDAAPAACHLRPSAGPSSSADCRWQPAGCHRAPMTTAFGLSHEDLLSPEALVLAAVPPVSAGPASRDRSTRTAFLDPPFVPPKSLLA